MSHKLLVASRTLVRNTGIRCFSSGKNELKVGFIGLGNMGGPMALNIAKSAAFQKNIMVPLTCLVTCSLIVPHVYDISPSNLNRLKESGVSTAKSIAQLAQYADVVVTMVPATQHVINVLKGDDGVFKHAKKGTILLDCSTIDPVASKNLSTEAKALGFDMIDAPVSGGVTGAAAGTLTFMVGGEENILKQVEPILNCMGKKIVLCGGAGSGSVTKLCNNLSLAISMIGTSEALSLGKRLGMDPNKLSQVMNTSTARCWSSDTYNPCPGVMENVPASRGYTGGFGSVLMEKDLGLALGAAKEVKARLPLGAAAHQIYGLMCEHGYSEKDFSSVYDFLYKNK